ncbi:MAG: hypothetical protein U0P46_11320 [Holophagaceae bacterium]
MKTTLFESLTNIWNSFYAKAMHLFPRLLAALCVLAAGWFLATLLQVVLKRIFRLARFDERCERSGLSLLLRRAEIPWTPTEIVGRITFWLVLVSAAIFSLSTLEMPVLDRMVAEFFLYLPRAFVAVAVLALGFLVANFLSRAALLLAVNEELPGPRLLGGTVRLLVNLLAFAMAMEQLGIARNTVTVAFAIAFGALMLGLALAFGLGGKDLAQELLARRFKPKATEGQDDIQHL